jgi:diguanylate cyclase (GGDEF)-like protein/PAS domain S-box-containing protein
MFRSKIIYLLIISSLIMLLLLVLIWMNGNREVDQQFKVINSTKQIVHKMHLIANMSEKARARTRLTSKLIGVDDYFVKDEIILEMDKMAAEFGVARSAFLQLPLNLFEQEMIEQQNKIISQVIKNHRLIVDMVMTDEPESLLKAKKILFDIVFPGQGKLIDLFMTMLRNYEENINKQTLLAQKNYSKNNDFRYRLLIAFILLAIFVSIFISRKIYIIEKSLNIEKQRTHITLMSIADAVITTDVEGIILDCNRFAEKLLRVSADQLLGNKFSSVVSLFNEETSVLADDFFESSLKNNKNAVTENLILQFDNNDTFIHIELLMSPILEQGNKAGCVITFRDVSEKKQLEQQLNQQAKYDALTGLLNRYSFELLCKNLLLNQDRRKLHALCVLDLDHFKKVNDNCGHGAGDIVLKELAEIMKLSIREQDFLSRIGGDEFTVILENCDENNALRIMNNIIKNISAYRFIQNEIKYTLGCSIGITEINHNDSSCSQVFKRADMSCYKAKNNGRNQVVTYSQTQIK